MATVVSRRLTTKFSTESDDTRTISISGVKSTLSESDAQAFLTAMVENGDAFVDPLKSGLRAEVVVTERTVLVDNE